MPHYERGVYEPTDEVRVFDGSEDDEDVEGSRLPLLIVLALLVLAMFAGVVWLAYTQGVARGRGEIPVLTAANGPERVAPQSGGDGTVPYQGFKIYAQPAPSDDTADNAPAAKPQANAAPTPAALPKPAPVAEAPKPAPAPIAAAPKPAPAAPAPVAAKPVTPPPAPVKAAATPAPKSATPAAAPPKSVAALIQQANSTPVPAAAKSAAAAPTKTATTPPPAMKQAVIPPPATATGAPRSLVAPTAAPATVAATPSPKPATAAPASGGIVLQIGAYKSQADADAAWKTYKAKHAALLSGYSDDIQQADLGEKGTWYRLRIGGMSNREVAAGLCDRLKADGGACILGK